MYVIVIIVKYSVKIIKRHRHSVFYKISPKSGEYGF